jgi:hypothetical protein
MGSRFGELLTREPAKWRYAESLLQFYTINENTLYSQSSLERLHEYLKSMSEVCRKNNAAMILYFVPGAVVVSNSSEIEYFPWDQNILDTSRYDLRRPFENLQKLTNDLGISVVDLTSSLQNHPRQPVYFPGSWHWNKEGHRVVSTVIAHDLMDRNFEDKHIFEGK